MIQFIDENPQSDTIQFLDCATARRFALKCVSMDCDSAVPNLFSLVAQVRKWFQLKAIASTIQIIKYVIQYVIQAKYVILLHLIFFLIESLFGENMCFHWSVLFL